MNEVHHCLFTAGAILAWKHGGLIASTICFHLTTVNAACEDLGVVSVQPACVMPHGGTAYHILVSLARCIPSLAKDKGLNMYTCLVLRLL